MYITYVQNIDVIQLIASLYLLLFIFTAEKYEEEVKDLENNNGRDRDRDNR